MSDVKKAMFGNGMLPFNIMTFTDDRNASFPVNAGNTKLTENDAFALLFARNGFSTYDVTRCSNSHSHLLFHLGRVLILNSPK